MTIDKQYEKSSNNEKASLEPTNEPDVTSEDSSFSKENLPSFSRILITDDGKDESNNVLKYAVSLSRSTGAELLILRIVKDLKQIEGISVLGSGMSNKNAKQEVKGGIIDEMEEKIKRCKKAGCENNISYKFRVGNAIEQIVNEVKDGNYNLVILRSTNIDSLVKSVFSNARKIISSIDIPVMVVR